MVDINKEEFPGNSHKEREIGDKPKSEKVIKGDIVRRKKSWINKFSETFLGGDVNSVASNVFWDVLVPAAKNTISEMINTGIDMLLFGETKGSSFRRDRERGKSYVSYSSIYKDKDRDRGREFRHETRIQSRYRFDDIIIGNRDDSKEVLEQLEELVETYGFATVADFYDLVGVPGEWTDNKWGWDNLSQATINRVRDGYILALPRPRELE